ncbi:MAG TPA: TniB family NTP-binding protein [Burkholderiaceae bacterium]|jgi:type II secretory pathway predicted ATPase ExeA
MQLDIIDPSDDWSEEERQVRARRMATYSIKAILAAREIARKYVIFPELRAVLAAFDRVYQLSREVGLPQGIVLTGPPGSSKTSVATYFMRSLPPASDVADGFGALSLRMRPSASAGFVISQILNAVRHPFTTVRQDRITPMRDIACEALQHKGTRVIFVDEAQCLLQRSRPRAGDDRDTSAGNLLREMMDIAGVGLVLLGDHRLHSLEEVDQGLADRVSVRMSLGPFGNDGTWATFLSELARNVKAIDLGLLADDSVRASTHAATGGCRRAVMRLVVEAVLVAVDAESTAVTQAHLRLAYQRTSGPCHAVPNPYGND